MKLTHRAKRILYPILGLGGIIFITGSCILPDGYTSDCTSIGSEVTLCGGNPGPTSTYRADSTGEYYSYHSGYSSGYYGMGYTCYVDCHLVAGGQTGPTVQGACCVPKEEANTERPCGRSGRT
jgi:hypothetical protein